MKPNGVSTHFGRGFWGRLGLQGRFMVYFGLIVLTLMALVVWLVENRMSTTLMQQTRMRGLAIGRSIAATVQSELLSYDYVSLQQAAETAAHDEGLLYVIILDKEEMVAAYSGSANRQGATLQDPVSIAAGAANGSLVQEVPPNLESEIPAAHLDIAVPVRVEGSPVRWGTVRVGLSLEPMVTTLAETRLLLVLLGLVAVLIVLASAPAPVAQITEPLGGLGHGVGEHRHRQPRSRGGREPGRRARRSCPQLQQDDERAEAQPRRDPLPEPASGEHGRPPNLGPAPRRPASSRASTPSSRSSTGSRAISSAT